MKIRPNRLPLWGILIFSYLVLWIIFFEFVLPVNKILPKPSIVIETIPVIFSEYDFIINLLSTVGVVYLSILTSTFSVYLLRKWILTDDSMVSHTLKSFVWISGTVPVIALGIFFIFWFPDSEIIEFIFATIVFFLAIVTSVRKANRNSIDEYNTAISSFGIDSEIIKKEIAWNSILPYVKEEMIRFHIFFWTIIISYEFIKGGYGLGSVYKDILAYNDLSALAGLTLLISIIILLFNFAIKNLVNRLIFWK